MKSSDLALLIIGLFIGLGVKHLMEHRLVVPAEV